jgi:hypothetical protein
MAFGATGILRNPYTGNAVTSQPLVTAYRTDTYAAHSTSVYAASDGTVTFLDLVDGVSYLALANIGLPMKAQVMWTQQFSPKPVAMRSFVPAVLMSETILGRSTISATPTSVNDDYLIAQSTLGRFLVRQTVDGAVDRSGRALLFTGAQISAGDTTPVVIGSLNGGAAFALGLAKFAGVGSAVSINMLVGLTGPQTIATGGLGGGTTLTLTGDSAANTVSVYINGGGGAVNVALLLIALQF